MDLKELLAGLLVAEIAIFAAVASLYSGVLRRFPVERRVTAELATFAAGHSQATVHQRRPRGLAQLCLFDLPEEHRLAIPWIGARFRLNPTASFTAFAWIRIAMLALGTIVPVFLFGFVLTNVQYTVPLILFSATTLAGANWWFAGRYVAGLARARRESISLGMPYALDLILICLDSGVALEAAISRVAAELSSSSPLVSEELYRTLLDINVLSSREQAFRNLGERIDTANMRTIVTVLCQSLQYGSSLAVSLKEAIQNMKRLELLDLEERAGKLPVQLTLPGMVFTLPQVIILLAGPGVVRLLETFKPT